MNEITMLFSNKDIIEFLVFKKKMRVMTCFFVFFFSHNDELAKTTKYLLLLIICHYLVLPKCCIYLLKAIDVCLILMS